MRVIGGIPTNTAINAGQATIYGAELEATLLYGSYGGRIDLNVGWLDAQFDEFVGLDDPLTPGQDNLDLGGSDMVNAPDWNISATWVPGELQMLKRAPVSSGAVFVQVQLHYPAPRPACRPAGFLYPHQCEPALGILGTQDCTWKASCITLRIKTSIPLRYASNRSTALREHPSSDWVVPICTSPRALTACGWDTGSEPGEVYARQTG